jgi:hypothetical protein
MCLATAKPGSRLSMSLEIPARRVETYGEFVKYST